MSAPNDFQGVAEPCEPIVYGRLGAFVALTVRATRLELWPSCSDELAQSEHTDPAMTGSVQRTPSLPQRTKLVRAKPYALQTFREGETEAARTECLNDRFPWNMHELGAALAKHQRTVNAVAVDD